MPRSISTSSTVEVTPSNSDENSYRDDAPMDDTINIKVPAAVAAEWIDNGVGIPDTQANHDKNYLAHIDGSRVSIRDREAFQAKVAKLEKNAFVDKNRINHMATQIMEKGYAKKAIHRMLARKKWELEELKKAASKTATKTLDGNHDPMPAPVGPTKLNMGTVKKVSHAPKLDRRIRSPSKTLSIDSVPTFLDLPSYITLRQQAKVGDFKKASNPFDLDRVINAFVPPSTDSRSTGSATAQPDKSATEKRLDASLNIDRAVEAFRAHLDDTRITSLSNLDSAIEAFRTELLHDKPAERIKTAIKKSAFCWICGLTDHLPWACPKATCGDCGQEGHIVQDCPQALDCDNSVHNHNHQAVKIDNSPEQTGGMHSPEAIKDCKGCWDGCDACCPELEDDANQQASAPVDARLGSPICSCGRCDSCLSSFETEDYCVRSPAPLPNRNGEMSFADLFQDPEVCRGCESGCDECRGDDVPDNKNSVEFGKEPDVGWAFHNLGFLDTEAVTFEELTTKFNELLKLRPDLAGVYGKSYATIIAHQFRTRKWAGHSLEHKQKKNNHAVIKGAADMKPTRLRRMSVPDDFDDLPDSNKENSDEQAEVKLPKWGAFGVYCLEQDQAKSQVRENDEDAIYPPTHMRQLDQKARRTGRKDRAATSITANILKAMRDCSHRNNKHDDEHEIPEICWDYGMNSEFDRSDKTDDELLRSGGETRNQDWGGGSGGWGPTLPPQSPSVRSTRDAMPFPRSFYSHPASDDSIPKNPAVRQPSINDLYSDSGYSKFTRISNEPLTITYSVIVQAGGKSVNIPLDGKNVSGVEKEVINGGMKKVWNWVLERGLSDKIDLQDAYELAKDMHGGVEEKIEGSEQSVVDTVSVRSRCEDGIPEPKGWGKAMGSPPPSLYGGAHGWGSAPATVDDRGAFLVGLDSAPKGSWGSEM